MRRILPMTAIVSMIVSVSAVAGASPAPFIPGAPGDVRRDIVVSITPGTIANLTLEGNSSIQTIKSGRFALRVDGNSSCAATPTSGCKATIIAGKIVLGDIAGVKITVSNGVTSETDTVTISQPTGAVTGLNHLTSDGNGFTVPTGSNTSTLARVTGTVLGSRFDNTAFSQTGTLSSDVTISYELLPTQEFAIEGSLPMAIDIGSTTLTGSVSFLASGSQPFSVSPPLANAGGDQSVTCDQSIALDGSRTIDQLGQSDIASFQWFDANGHVIAQGQTAQVSSLPLGVNPITLLVKGQTGAQTFTVIDVTVHPGAPTISASPPATLQSCSTGPSAVAIAVPTAHVCGAKVAVTGTVTSFNGAAVSIPVTAGTVDVPPGSGTVQWVATNQDGVSTTVIQSITVLSPATLLGLHGVEIDDGSAVQGTIYAGGGGTTLLEPDARLTQVFSLSPVSVRDRVTAALIDTNAAITFSNAGTDHIAATSSAMPILPVFPDVATTFTGTTPEVVNPTPEPGSVISLAPGQYGNVTVFYRGKLILSRGAYAFRSLDLEPQATIVTPSASSEAVQVFVESSVIYRGSTVDSTGAPAPLFLAYLGTNALDIGTAFTGTIVAPNAFLGLQSLNGQGAYTGEFFAKQITVSPHDTVISNPFTCK